jgi:trans-AT polyketide synthase, acyltransferase and oxidoreductase domains
MRRAFIFPGQGSQSTGMGKDLWDRFPHEVEQADDILGYSVRQLCLEDTNGQLAKTEYLQPALYIVCALSYLARKESGETEPDILAGHSLGEYTALFAAGAFDFATGVRLVAKRGRLMARADGGAMAAVVGLTASKVSALLAQQGLEDVDLANDNSPSQLVISGPAQAVARASEALKASGARHCVALKVSAAFHSRAMRPAAEAFRRFIDPVEFEPLRIPVIANVTARPYEPSETHEMLSQQITAPVRWTESMQYLIGQGVSEFVEVGPGNVLTGLVRQIRSQAA